MNHPKISVSVSLSLEPYGNSEVSVSIIRNVVEAAIEKSSAPTSEELLNLLPFLQRHVTTALSEARSQLLALSANATERQQDAVPATSDVPF